MTARAEELMSALINGGTVNFAPHSRMEEYLMRCLEGGGTEGLPTPISRIDAQLYEIIENGGMGTGGGTYVPDEDVATDEEVEQTMDEIFGDTSEDDSGTGEDSGDDTGTEVPDEAVATDEEVSAMMDEVFDNPVVN